MLITLTQAEIEYVNQVADKRTSANREANRGRWHGPGVGGADRVGAAGEFAFAKATNLRWTGEFMADADWQENKHRVHDVEIFEIRTTKLSKGRLYGHRGDQKHLPYVLVRCPNFPTLEIVGWAFGDEIQQEENWFEGKHDRPFFLLPVEELRPMQGLGSFYQAGEEWWFYGESSTGDCWYHLQQDGWVPQPAVGV